MKPFFFCWPKLDNLSHLGAINTSNHNLHEQNLQENLIINSVLTSYSNYFLEGKMEWDIFSRLVSFYKAILIANDIRDF